MSFLRCLGYLDFIPEVNDEQMAFLHLFFIFFCEGWGRAPPAVISPRLFLNHTENNHLLGH